MTDLRRSGRHPLRRVLGALCALLLPAVALSLVAPTPAGAASNCAFPVVCIDTMTLSTSPASGTPLVANLSGGAASSLTVKVTGTGSGQMNFRVVLAGPGGLKREAMGTLTSTSGGVTGTVTLNLREGNTGLASASGLWQVYLLKPSVEWNYNIYTSTQELFILNGAVVAEPFTDAQWQMSSSPSDWGTPITVGATPRIQPTDRSLSYQWCAVPAGSSTCTNISGATGASYTPTADRIGQVVHRHLVASRSGYTSLTLRSPGVTVRAKVTAAPPEPTYAGDGSSYTIPNVDGVVYTVNGTVRAPGTHPTGGVLLTTVASPAANRRLPSGNQTWTRDLRTPVLTQDVVAGTAPHSIVVPSVPGVDYRVQTTTLSPGEQVRRAQFTVTAVPSGPTYRLVGTTSWTFDLRGRVTPEVTADEQQMRYTLAPVEGVTYRVGGVVRAPGTYTATGPVTVTAAAADASWVLAPGAQSSWTFAFTTTTIAPPAPTAGVRFVTVPDVPGVEYRAGGETLAPGRWDVADEVTVRAVAASPHITLTGTTEWSFDTRELVVPQPVLVDQTQMTVTFPDVAGVRYTATGLDTSPGTRTPGAGQWTVTAAPEAGYRFPAGTWRWDVALAFTDRTVPPLAASDGHVLLPYAEGVQFLVNGVLATSSYHYVGHAVARVEAVGLTPRDRVVGTSEWTFDLRKVVTPAVPLFDADRHLVIVPRDSSEVRYRIDGAVAQPGSYPVTGTVTVTAEAEDAQSTVLAPDAVRSWSFTASVREVTAEAPTLDAATSTLTVPLTTGAEYLVNGKPTSVGQHPVSGLVQVTARPSGPGIRLVGTTAWTFDLRGPGTGTLTPLAPTFAAGTARLTVPAVPGVAYRVGGQDLAPGRHRVVGRFRVVARATGTTPLAAGATSTWTFTSAVSVASRKPAFRRKKGRLVVPRVTGLQYRVNGKVTAAGRKVRVKKGAKIVVTVTARVGYRVTGKKRWTFRRPR